MNTDLSETELLILQYLWSLQKPASFSDIMEHFHSVEKKEWKKQTINTFLTRLAQKGFLIVDKSHRKALYSPALTMEEYYQQYTKKIVDSTFQGSLKNFVSAFTGNKKLTESEKSELLDFIDGL